MNSHHIQQDNFNENKSHILVKTKACLFLTKINVKAITILGTVIIGGMIRITRSNVKVRIWVKS